MPSDRNGDADATVHPGRDVLILDVMLGKLAVYLRMCGYDAAYAGDRGIEADDRLRDVARREGRLLLSRDRELVAEVERGLLLAERDVADQLAELRSAGFELALADPPTRCGRCNGPLAPIPAETTRPDYVPAPDQVDCWRCTACGQYFWKGSHWDRVSEVL